MRTTTLGLRLLLGPPTSGPASAVVLDAWSETRTLVGCAALLGVSARQLSRWVDTFADLAPIAAELRPTPGKRRVAPGQRKRGPNRPKAAA